MEPAVTVTVPLLVLFPAINVPSGFTVPSDGGETDQVKDGVEMRLPNWSLTVAAKGRASPEYRGYGAGESARVVGSG